MNPTELHENLVKLGEEKARTQAYAKTTDRLRKEVRATWMVHHINKGETLGKSEQLALIEPGYIEACERAEKAEEDAGIAAVGYSAAQSWFDAWRTIEATKRAEMGLK